MAYEHMYEMQFEYQGYTIIFPFSFVSKEICDAEQLTPKNLAVGVFSKVQNSTTKQLLSDATAGESDTPNYGYDGMSLTADILVSGLQKAINSYLKEKNHNIVFTHLMTIEAIV